MNDLIGPKLVNAFSGNLEVFLFVPIFHNL